MTYPNPDRVTLEAMCSLPFHQEVCIAKRKCQAERKQGRGLAVCVWALGVSLGKLLPSSLRLNFLIIYIHIYVYGFKCIILKAF